MHLLLYDCQHRRSLSILEKSFYILHVCTSKKWSADLFRPSNEICFPQVLWNQQLTFLTSVCFLRCLSGLSFIFDWKDVTEEKFILYSLSRTWRLGNAVLRARRDKVSPVERILQQENGKLLITGKVVYK